MITISLFRASRQSLPKKEKHLFSDHFQENQLLFFPINDTIFADGFPYGSGANAEFPMKNER
jgi:hypothetical protein